MVQLADRCDEIRPRRKRIDTCELELNRLQTERIDGCSIHAGGEVVAHLLLHGSAVLRLCIGLENAPQELLVFVAKLGVDAPAGLVGGDRVFLFPAAAGELVEIHAGVY